MNYSAIESVAAALSKIYNDSRDSGDIWVENEVLKWNDDSTDVPRLDHEDVMLALVSAMDDDHNCPKDADLKTRYHRAANMVLALAERKADEKYEGFPNCDWSYECLMKVIDETVKKTALTR